MKIKEFVFNPFQENTYVLYDDTLDCVIVDAGCYDKEEEEILVAFLKANQLKPVALLNTHCHIDHVFGNAFIFQQYSLQPQMHAFEELVLEAAPRICEMYGLQMRTSPPGKITLTDNGIVHFGNTDLKMILVPGHSPGSICFYHEKEGKLIGGDVLFHGSIGRTDLPGGDLQTLLSGIQQRLFILPDEVVVYPGHGPTTTIGYEKQFNPFLKDTSSFAS